MAVCFVRQGAFFLFFKLHWGPVMEYEMLHNATAMCAMCILFTTIIRTVVTARHIGHYSHQGPAYKHLFIKCHCGHIPAAMFGLASCHNDPSNNHQSQAKLTWSSLVAACKFDNQVNLQFCGRTVFAVKCLPDVSYSLPSVLFCPLPSQSQNKSWHSPSLCVSLEW